MISPSQYFSYASNSSIITINLLTLATVVSPLDWYNLLRYFLPSVFFLSKHSSTAGKVIFLKWKCDHVAFSSKAFAGSLGLQDWNQILWHGSKGVTVPFFCPNQSLLRVMEGMGDGYAGIAGVNRLSQGKLGPRVTQNTAGLHELTLLISPALPPTPFPFLRMLFSLPWILFSRPSAPSPGWLWLVL